MIPIFTIGFTKYIKANVPEVIPYLFGMQLGWVIIPLIVTISLTDWRYLIYGTEGD